MDPTELIKAGPQLVKGAAAIGAVVPFTSIVKRMLGPAADELAEMWRDQIRLYRYERQLKCVQKAERMAQEAGFTPQAVPPKILFPLLEGASFEDNEDLHTMWAALLANASTASAADLVRPSFCELLSLMTSDVARLLNLAFDYATEKAHPPPQKFRRDLGVLETAATKKSSVIEEMSALTRSDLGTYRHLYRRFSNTLWPSDQDDTVSARVEDDDNVRDHRFAVVMDELDRMQMWTTSRRETGDHYYLSALAAQFVMVCRQPAQQSS
jgi:hypothetical protein